MILAAHQPNFFPWMGYFAKIAASDVFVLMDRADWPRRSYVHRVKLRAGDDAKWMICPTERADVGTAIRDIRIADDAGDWRRKMMGTLKNSYGKAAFHRDWASRIEELIGTRESLIGSYNASCIRTIADWLGIESRIVEESDVLPLDHPARGSDRFVALCGELGADVYLAGDGADGYEKYDAYAANGLRLSKVGFSHPAYDQGGRSFLAGLSVLDALLHIGPGATRAFIQEAARKARDDG